MRPKADKSKIHKKRNYKSNVLINRDAKLLNEILLTKKKTLERKNHFHVVVHMCNLCSCEAKA